MEGAENLQEVLSKRLYLCQLLAAISVLAAGGSYVCKLFDVTTAFSAALVYLAHRAFRHTALFQPLTSRPANSERSLISEFDYIN